MIIGCDDCGMTTMSVLMLQDELWAKVALRSRILCHNCIEERLGRPLTLRDLKPCGATNQIILGARLALNTPDLDHAIINDMMSEHSKIELERIDTFENRRIRSIRRQLETRLEEDREE